MANRDLGDVTVSLGFEGIHSTRIRVAFGPDKAVRLVVDHVPSYVIVVAEKEVLLTNEALAEGIGLLPCAFECEVPKVVDFVTGAHHGVMAVSKCGVHFFDTGERPTLPKFQNVFVVKVVVRREEDVWFR